MSAALRAGRRSASSRARRSSPPCQRVTGGSNRSSSDRRRRPIASGCPTAPCSASSRRRRRRSARACDRSRLTADGMWYLCLYAARGIDLRGALRGGASADDLQAIIAEGWARAHRSRRRRAPGARRSAGVRAGTGPAEKGSAPRDAHARRIAVLRRSSCFRDSRLSGFRVPSTVFRAVSVCRHPSAPARSSSAAAPR